VNRLRTNRKLNMNSGRPPLICGSYNIVVRRVERYDDYRINELERTMKEEVLFSGT
jgi:hypothetical protein